MRLLLIRHGQTPSNVAGLLDTRIPGPGLTELGLDQAAALPVALANEAIESIHVSDMIRTHLTAAPLAAATGLTPIERGGVREVASGDYEMKSDEASVVGYMTTVFAWAQGDLDVRMPGGESGVEVFARFDAVVDEIVSTGASVAAIVSHGAMIRGWTGHTAGNIDAEYIADHNLDNTGVVVLEGSPAEGWTLVSWMGEAVGGDALDDVENSGPTGETVDA